jgi:hypothetical protein
LPAQFVIFLARQCQEGFPMPNLLLQSCMVDLFDLAPAFSFHGPQSGSSA